MKRTPRQSVAHETRPAAINDDDLSSTRAHRYPFRRYLPGDAASTLSRGRHLIAGSGCVRCSFALAMLLAIGPAAHGQLISLKTVPVAAGDQFVLFPSATRGMAGVTIAIDDPLLDPFRNPGHGGRLSGGLMFTSPSFYDISGDNGSGRALPVGGLYARDRWFGGLALSLQELEMADRGFGGFGAPTRLSEVSSGNTYAFGLVGTRLPDAGISLGASVFWAGLDALEGVELLYAGASEIEQSGHLVDVRVGLAGTGDSERTYEAILLYSGIDMTHEVTYPGVFVAPGTPVPDGSEENLDRTNTWGLYLNYAQPMNDEGWRIGGSLTGNYKTHPKIPNYDLMNIPRDPGDSWAFELGAGVSRTVDYVTFGADLVLQPAWSETWAEAAEPVTTVSGRIIPVGEKTVDNDFRFSNIITRLGLAWAREGGGFQFGLQLKSIDYTLEQVDMVAETKRKQEESWREWTPTWGGHLDFGEVELWYSGRLTTGTGRPGVEQGFIARGADFSAASSDYLLAPEGTLTLIGETVWAHQLAVILPVR